MSYYMSQPMNMYDETNETDERVYGDLVDIMSSYKDDNDLDSVDSVLTSSMYYDPGDLLGIKSPNMYSYFHINCRGLSRNWNSFIELLHQIHNDEFAFDFIGFSECFKCDKDSRVYIPGYHLIITRSRQDSYHGGVGLFVKNSINYTVREDL